MPAPIEFIEHLRSHGYHPRSNAHGNAICEAVLRDLRSRCPRIAEDLGAGRIVYDLNVKLRVGNNVWNIDLVLGPPPAEFSPQRDGLARIRPVTIRVAVETKAIMTEHGKARRNRQRDLDSFHQFVHRYNSSTIAAALTVVNIAERFRSPLRPAISVHRNITRLTGETLTLLRLRLETHSTTTRSSNTSAINTRSVGTDHAIDSLKPETLYYLEGIWG